MSFLKASTRRMCVCILTFMSVNVLFLMDATQATDKASDVVAKQAWSIAKSIGLRTYVTAAGEVATSSPDGRYFFIVSHYGDLDCDCNTFTMSVYDAGQVVESLVQGNDRPLPVRSVKMKSPLIDNGIYKPQWHPDSKSIIFSGKDSEGRSPLYRLFIETGKMQSLARPELSAANLKAIDRDSLIIGGLIELPIPDLATYPSFVAAAQSLGPMSMYSGSPWGSQDGRRWDMKNNPSESRLYYSYNGRKPKLIKSGRHALPLSMSGVSQFFTPDSKKAILLLRPHSVPSHWRAYDATSKSDIELDPYLFPMFVILDFVKGHDKPVFDAPVGVATHVGKRGNQIARLVTVLDLEPKALWSNDGEHVVLVNTALPLNPTDPERAQMAYVVDYNVDTGEWKIIEPVKGADDVWIKSVDWLEPGKKLLIRREKDGAAMPGAVYSFENGEWIGAEVSSDTVPPVTQPPVREKLVGGLRIRLEQGLNEPPSVVAALGGHEIVLSEPDPMLENSVWAKSQLVIWRDSKGVEHESTLLLPPTDLRPAGRMPLVIQMGYNDFSQFQLDGPARSGYAAQALVARGIAVLNVDGVRNPPDRKITNSPEELELFRDFAESAAEALAEQGLIDIDRVGLMGFSRNSYLSYFTITHPRRVRFAAAMMADGYLGSYGYFQRTIAIQEVTDAYNTYGGSFYDNKQLWFELEPSFNIDKVQTPALFIPGGFHDTMELMGGFRDAGKPMEAIIFPFLTHNASRPMERAAMMQAHVDWMTFWLKGELPADDDRAERWMELRRQQQSILDKLEEEGESVAELPNIVPSSVWMKR